MITKADIKIKKIDEVEDYDFEGAYIRTYTLKAETTHLFEWEGSVGLKVLENFTFEDDTYYIYNNGGFMNMVAQPGKPTHANHDVSKIKDMILEYNKECMDYQNSIQ